MEKSRRYLAGGVSSGMRASAKPVPLFFSGATGSHLTDVDGNNFIDYTLAWGPLILGHAHPMITGAVKRQLDSLQLVGAQHELEISVSEKICRMVPCAELVTYNNSGSEAVQMAIRLARAFTGRYKIVRFEGHYHGWFDNMLIGYRPPTSECERTDHGYSQSGIAKGGHDEVCVLPWNDLDQVEATLRKLHEEIAAIITEPILCNCHCLMPSAGYLEGLKKLATHYGVVLIFDEVITGFRVAPGGAQDLFGVTPHLAIFGKAIANGFPLSVVAGQRHLMELIEQGRVVHAGTFNGNPISLAAADATLDILGGKGDAPLNDIKSKGEYLISEIKRVADKEGIPVLTNGVGAAFHVAFTTRTELLNYRDTLEIDPKACEQFVGAMLESGIYLLPDGRWYISAAHTEEDIERTVTAIQQVFRTHKEGLIARGSPSKVS